MLRRWPLPMPDAQTATRKRADESWSSEVRARCPARVILAANAALRAGAGKLAIATSRSVAALVAVAIPEARVMALAESRSGWIAPAAARSLDVDDGFDAVLVGPGMENENATRKFRRSAAAQESRESRTPLVLDARALSVLVAAPNRVITRSRSRSS